MAATHRLVVGTAGHIDHGKSRLVQALTGQDPDRLPEEKSRGMTIDLGFAYAQLDGCDVWFVDVPGHERFIRNMLAGAGGVDLALLVVAADDAVMPQTEEHAEVLRLLGIRDCVVALTKIDLVDDEWADAVEEEVRGLLGKLDMQPLQVVRTSAETGRGIEELRGVLAGHASERGQRPATATWFRMPVDRAFSVPGRGTVVTGSVAHGGVQSDDELELWPAGRVVRVRDLQTHHAAQEAARGRMRLASNLASIAPEEAPRGCTLATPGYLAPTRVLDAQLTWLRLVGKRRGQTLRLRLHLATAETLCQLRLLDPPDGPRVMDAFAQLKLQDTVVAAWGDRFILRDESGQRTLGGGQVLHPAPRVWSGRRPARREGLEALCAQEEQARLEEVVYAAEWQPTTLPQLAARAGLADAVAAERLVGRLKAAGRMRVLSSGELQLYVHNDRLAALGEDLERRLGAYRAAHPRQPGVPWSQWPGWMPAACPAKLRGVLAEWYVADGPFRRERDHVLAADAQAELPAEDQALLEALLAAFAAAAFQPPALEELDCHTAKNGKRLRELVEYAVAQELLVRVADGLWLHAERWRELVQIVSGAIRERGPLKVAEIRTLLNSSRKYVVPLVERLDAAGVTQRRGDTRVLGPAADGGAS
jgi:selenocysteine-specific elongation factor